MSSGYAPLSSWILNPSAPASTSASRCESSAARAPACKPMLTGQPSSPASTRSIAHGGSSKPAVISVVTPPARAGGSSSGPIVWTWLSTAPGVAISPYAMYDLVWGPMTRSMPSLISGLPDRPMPAMRPSLMPMSALTTPMTGSTTRAPVSTMSSSEGPVAESDCAIRERRFFA